MRIAFLGNFGVDFSSESHHAKSLEALGHEVVRLQEGYISAENILAEAFDCEMFVWVHTHAWSTPGTLTMTEVLKLLKEQDIPTVTYHLDLWFGIERQKDLEDDPFYKEIGYFFATDKLMCDWFNENTEVKAVYLPAGVFHEEVYMAEPKLEKRNQNMSLPLERKHDVIFVGSRGYHPEWAYRPKLIDWLKTTYRNGFAHAGGDGELGVVRGAELNQLYADSNIAVGDTLCINFDYPYYFSDRLFETTGRGGFLIFPYIKGIEDQFVIEGENKEIETYKFDDFDDLKQKIEFYLDNEDEREAIRKRGFERAKKDHTYINRWQFIIDTVTEGKS